MCFVVLLLFEVSRRGWRVEVMMRGKVMIGFGAGLTGSRGGKRVDGLTDGLTWVGVITG